MTLQQYREDVKKEINELLPCINGSSCDKNGSIASMDSNGDWEQEQCQYCFTVRFPIIDKLDEAITKTLEVAERGVVPEEKAKFSLAPKGYGADVAVAVIGTWNECVKDMRARFAELKGGKV